MMQQQAREKHTDQEVEAQIRARECVCMGGIANEESNILQYRSGRAPRVLRHLLKRRSMVWINLQHALLHRHTQNSEARGRASYQSTATIAICTDRI